MRIQNAEMCWVSDLKSEQEVGDWSREVGVMTLPTARKFENDHGGYYS
jgi:hypothetical protein